MSLYLFQNQPFVVRISPIGVNEEKLAFQNLVIMEVCFKNNLVLVLEVLFKFRNDIFVIVSETACLRRAPYQHGGLRCSWGLPELSGIANTALNCSRIQTVIIDSYNES